MNFESLGEFPTVRNLEVV